MDQEDFYFLRSEKTLTLHWLFDCAQAVQLEPDGRLSTSHCDMVNDATRLVCHQARASQLTLILRRRQLWQASEERVRVVGL